MGTEGELPALSPVHGVQGHLQVQVTPSPAHLLSFPVQHISMHIFQSLLFRLNVITLLMDLAKMHILNVIIHS